MLSSRIGLLLFATALVYGIACTGGAPSPDRDTASPAAGSAASPDRSVAAIETWWNHFSALCGQAYAGSLVSRDEADADLAGQAMVMHVRRCEPDRLEVPFHIGDNRSRTWVLTRTAAGVQLRHDHRHEDGSADDVTLYGGHTAGNGRVEGNAIALDFPADELSKQLFSTHGLNVSMANVWTMEIVPGERFSYILRRPGRHFQADFDLGQAVEPPPAPWGHT